MSKPVLAFDVYGTLINTHGVVTQLEMMVGDQARLFSQTWRDKQLEYAFRRGLMKRYADFAICTREALEYTCQSLQQSLSTEQKQQLMAAYSTLPAFDDVIPALEALQQADIPMFAFSNGKAAAVKGLLTSAGIHHYFNGIVSVDDIQSFKPDPAVYYHFLQQARHQLGQPDIQAEDCWLISGNPFDVTGAVATGMHAAWVQRSDDAVFDPWDLTPDCVVSDLTGLGQQLQRL